MPIPKSWVVRLPRGLREQPGWIFIGFMVFLVGLGYVTTVTTSTVEDAIGDRGLQGWGFFLMVTGVLVVYATWTAKPALEKMSLRWLVFALLAYTTWLMTVVDLSRAAMTLVLSSILIVSAEIRVGYIKVFLSIIDRTEDGKHGGNNG